MKTQNTVIDFTKNIKVSVEIQDLEKLGWNFDELYQNNFCAHQYKYKWENQEEDQTYDMNTAESYVQENYHIVIVVDEKGKVFWILEQKFGNESSDREWAGDDEQSIKDLIQLHSEGLLWGIENLDKL